jgi:hypothetical protein
VILGVRFNQTNTGFDRVDGRASLPQDIHRFLDTDVAIVACYYDHEFSSVNQNFNWIGDLPNRTTIITQIGTLSVWHFLQQ